MIVDTKAYVLSLILIFTACIVRDFIIPLFVWRNYLKDKSNSYRFWFCVITQAAIQINMVLILGIFDICNRFTFIGFNILVYLLIMWNFSDKKFFVRCKGLVKDLWNAYKEERLARYVVQTILSRTKKCIRAMYRFVLEYRKAQWVETLLLGAIVIYSIWFLTHNVLLYHSYQFPDIIVHQSWIYELEHGTLFSDGIYPFGMHSMIYFIRAVFRLSLREIMLYAGAYQAVVLIIGLYMLAKEIFVGKYTPITVILIFSFMLNQGRYAASLPQEAGMYAVIGLAYFMLRYLHSDKKKHIITQDSKIRSIFRLNTYINRRYISSEMLLLMLSVTLVIAYHYYTAIAAIFVVLAIGLAYIPKILKKQYFVPLLYCGIMGAVIAIVPTGICLAKGMPFQESIEWATTVMSGNEWRGSEVDYQDDLASALGIDQGGESHSEADLEADTEREAKIDYSRMSIKEIMVYYYDSIAHFGEHAMFDTGPTIVTFVCMLLGIIFGLIMLLSKKTAAHGHDYIALVIIMLIFFTLGASEALGIPELIEAARASTFAQPFIGFIFMLPIDMIFRVFSLWKNRYYQLVLKTLSLAMCGIAAIIIIEAGWYHNFFDVNLTYYNEADYVLQHIKKDYQKNTYTVVSPTEEYYDMVDYGRHTELSKFVNMINGNEESFTFTTEYVFFFIEKVALMDYNYGPVKVDLQYAAKDFVYMGDIQDYYHQRVVIESQAYYWAKKFEQIYPRNFKVYYEDDIYIVYRMEQNTYSPYELPVDYLEGELALIKDRVNAEEEMK